MKNSENQWHLISNIKGDSWMQHMYSVIQCAISTIYSKFVTHLKHDNLHFMFTCEQKAMIQYKCSVEWLFVWPDRCYFIRTVNEKSMHRHLQHNWWSCRYFSTFIDSREWKKTLRKRDDKISTSKTTWSEQRSKFPKRTKSSPLSYRVWSNILSAFYQHRSDGTLYLPSLCKCFIYTKQV